VNEADLVSTSGRESMSVKDRIDLLRHDLVQLQHAVAGIELGLGKLAPSVRSRKVQGPTGATIHDYNCLIGWVRGTILLFDRAIERGTPIAKLQKGADRMCSDAECLILAFRRGGQPEYRKTRIAQIARDKL
jgi:hypothetical protein